MGKVRHGGSGEVKMAISWEAKSSSMAGGGELRDQRLVVESEVDGEVWLEEGPGQGNCWGRDLPGRLLPCRHHSGGEQARELSTSLHHPAVGQWL